MENIIADSERKRVISFRVCNLVKEDLPSTSPALTDIARQVPLTAGSHPTGRKVGLTVR